MMAADGILFDLDGTLWNATARIQEGWNLGREELGLAPTLTLRQVEDCMGLLIEPLARRLLPELEESRLPKGIEVCVGHQLACLAGRGGILYPRLEETLAQLAGSYKLFIVSNCVEGYIQAFFAAHGLGKYFTDFEYPGRTGKAKAENITSVVKRNNLKRPVYVGDTQGDYDAATAAGVPFIHAAYGFGTVDAPVPAISSFDQLPQLLTGVTPP